MAGLVVLEALVARHQPRLGLRRAHRWITCISSRKDPRRSEDPSVTTITAYLKCIVPPQTLAGTFPQIDTMAERTSPKIVTIAITSGLLRKHHHYKRHDPENRNQRCEHPANPVCLETLAVQIPYWLM